MMYLITFLKARYLIDDGSSSVLPQNDKKK